MKKRASRHRILDGLPLSLDLFPSQDQPATAWHQVALEGKWAGHWQGPFSLDGKTLEQMVEHRAAASVDTVVDYEHGSIFADQSPAAGWIKALETRESGGSRTLWAQIEWTERAADHIRAREYRYLSPTIVFNTRDRKSSAMTGASLHSVALTNKPFLQELPEVRLNALSNLFTDDIEENPMNEVQFKALCKDLGLPETASVEEVTAAVARARQQVALSAIACTELGLQPNASDKDVQGAILRLKAPPAVSAADFAALQMRLAERDASDAVGKALSEHKLTAAGTPQHVWALDYAKKDLAGFNAWALAAPALVGLGLKAPGGKPVVDAELTEDEQRACSKLGMTPAEFIAANKRGDAIRSGAPIAQIQKGA